jgi:hypothetical protein
MTSQSTHAAVVWQCARQCIGALMLCCFAHGVPDVAVCAICNERMLIAAWLCNRQMQWVLLFVKLIGRGEAASGRLCIGMERHVQAR